MSLAFEGQNENRLPLRPPLHGSGPRFFKPLDNSRQFAFSKVVVKKSGFFHLNFILTRVVKWEG